jgi:hypothetical protein
MAALGEAVWSVLVVGSVECAIDGTVVRPLNDGTVICALNDGTVICVLNASTVICALDDGMLVCTLDDALYLFFFLLCEVDFVDKFGTVEVNAVAGDMILRSLTRLHVMVIAGDDMEHLPRPNVDVYPAVSN